MQMVVAHSMNRTDIKMVFASAIRLWREKHKITQEELAERANLHRTYISDIERGVRNLSLENINKLAHALEVSIPELFRESAEPTGEEPGIPSRGRCVDILLVEDNTDDVDLTLDAFGKAHFLNRVDVVNDGEAAMDYLLCRGIYEHRNPLTRPQIVLLDLGLPKMGGLEVLRQIKAHKNLRRIIPVILTASQEDQDFAECRRLGVKNYIIKPVDFQGLCQITPTMDLHWALVQPSMAMPGSPVVGAAC